MEERDDRRSVWAVRGMFLLAAAAIPAYGWLYARWAPSATEFMGERLVLSGFCLLMFALSWTRWVRVRPWFWILVLAWAFTAWQWRLVVVNRFGTLHVISSFMVCALVSAALRSRRELTLYCGSTFAAYAGALLLVPDVAESREFLLINFGILSGALWLIGSSRISYGDRLRESEEMRRVMADQSRDAVVLVDPIGRQALEWNRRAGELLEMDPGRDRKEMAAAAFGAAEWREVDAVVVLKEIGMHGAYSRQHAFLTRGGKAFWGDLSVISVRLGRRTLLLARIADASGWRRAEEALRAEQEVYRHLAEDSGAFVARVGSSGIIDEISPSVERLLGWRPEELKGTRFSELVMPERRGALESWPGVRPEEARYTLGRFAFRTAAGGERPLECQAWHVIDPESRTLLEAVVVGRDVSEEHDIEDRLRRGRPA